MPCPGAARPGLPHSRRGPALPDPATPIPDGSGSVRPGVHRLPPALPAPSPAGKHRGARPGVPDGGDRVPAATGRDGRTPPLSLGCGVAGSPRRARAADVSLPAGRNPTGPSREGRRCAGTRPAGGQAGGQSRLCLFIVSRTESLICVCRGGRREEAGVRARLSSLPVPALVRLGSRQRPIPVKCFPFSLHFCGKRLLGRERRTTAGMGLQCPSSKQSP